MTADINLGDNYEIDEDSNGDMVVKDSTGTTVLKHTDGGSWSLGANADVSGNDLVDGANTIYDTSDGHIPNGIVEALVNLSAGDSFGGYPLSLATDTDRDVAGNDLVDGANAIYDSTDGHIPNAIVEALANLAAGDSFSAYPLAVGTDTDHTAADHEDGGSLEMLVESMATSSTASSDFFGPDGNGGVEVRSAGGGATTGERALIYSNNAEV